MACKESVYFPVERIKMMYSCLCELDVYDFALVLLFHYHVAPHPYTLLVSSEDGCWYTAPHYFTWFLASRHWDHHSWHRGYVISKKINQCSLFSSLLNAHHLFTSRFKMSISNCISVDYSFPIFNSSKESECLVICLRSYCAFYWYRPNIFHRITLAIWNDKAIVWYDLSLSSSTF